MIFESLLRIGASSSDGPDSDFWFRPVGFSSSQGWISPERAMQSTAVFACVRIIAETVASIPCLTYRRLERGKERAADHPMYRLLRWRPNPWQNSLEFFEMMTGHTALRGNGYAEKMYGQGGRLEGLLPLHPDRVQVDQLDGGNLAYVYTDPRTGRQYRYREDEIFHLRGLTGDGRIGLSPIGFAAQTIGSALAADDYGARFFENDATPSGILYHPQHFKDKESRTAFREAWQKAQSGSNRGKTAVLEDGVKFEKVGLTNTDAQFLETRKYGVVDIARIFRVPLVLLGETEKSTSWGSGVEQFMLSFITHTVRPWCVRWEQALQRDFFDDETVDDEYFAEFLLEALLRADQKTRYESYSKGINDGWLLRNEARAFENMNPLPGLDEPLQPLNMGKANEQPAPDGEAAPPRRPPEDDDEESAAARQVVRKELAAIRRAYETHLGMGSTARLKLEGWARRFYGVHAAYVAEKVGSSREFARRYCDAQLAELLDAVAAECVETPAGELPVQLVPALLDAWEDGRAAELVAQLRSES